jgi:hypothetical protein
MGTVWSYFLYCCHLSSISWRGLWQAHDFFWHSLSRERVPSRRVFVKFLERSLSSCLSSIWFAQIKGTDDTLLHCATDNDFNCNANGVCSLQCLHCTITAAESWEATKRNVLSRRLYIEKTLESPSPSRAHPIRSVFICSFNAIFHKAFQQLQSNCWPITIFVIDI